MSCASGEVAGSELCRRLGFVKEMVDAVVMSTGLERMEVGVGLERIMLML